MTAGAPEREAGGDLEQRARRGEYARIVALVTGSVILNTLSSAITDEKLTFLYKEDMHLSATAVTGVNLLLALPAYLQPIIGAWTDIIPWLGYHRRSYYLFGTLLAIVCFMPLAFLHQYHYATVVTALLASGAGAVLSSVVFNAVMVAVGNRTGTFDRLQSISMLIPLILGTVYTSHLGGYIAEHWSYQRTFGTAAALSFLNLPLVLLMDEPAGWRRAPGRQKQEDAAERAARLAAHRAQLRAAIRHIFSTRGFWVFLAFLGAIALAPAPLTAMTYFETDRLHFSKQLIGDLDIYTSAGTLLGLGAWALVSRKIRVRYLAWGYFLTNLLTYGCFLGIHSPSSAKAMMFLSGVIAAIDGLCSTLLMARACPPDLEGTIWGLLGAVDTLFSLLCDRWGSALYDAYGPAHHHTVVYGWRVSLAVGFFVALLAGLLLPFLPAWTKSPASIREGEET